MQLLNFRNTIKGYNNKYTHVLSKQQVNNKGVDQTVPMCRLICGFAVHIGINKNFIMTSLNYIHALSSYFLLNKLKRVIK